MIKDVLDVSLTILLQVQSEADILHPIQIRSRKKKYTLCFKDLHERNFYYNCLEILVKYTKEWLSPAGLKKYCEVQIKNHYNQNILAALNESYAKEH